MFTPVQRPKRYPARGVAVSGTSLFATNVAEQSSPQAIPAGSERTRPRPFFEMLSVAVP